MSIVIPFLLGMAVGLLSRFRQRPTPHAEPQHEQLVAVVAHELRSPLSVLSNTLNLLRLRGVPVPPAVEVSLEQMTRLVDDLTDASRLSRGRVQLRPASFDLRELLLSLLPDFEVRAAAKGLTLEVEAETPLILFADAVRVSQVLANLVGNAIKFTSEGRVVVRLRDSGGWASFSVADEGDGIDPPLLPHLWDPFYQGDGAELKGGMGIGLFVVKGVVELHGGRVHCHSDGIGHGAVFTVDLPLEEGLNRTR